MVPRLLGYKGHKWSAAVCVNKVDLPTSSGILTTQGTLGLQKISPGPEEVGTALEAAESGSLQGFSTQRGGRDAPWSFLQ